MSDCCTCCKKKAQKAKKAKGGKGTTLDLELAKMAYKNKKNG